MKRLPPVPDHIDQQIREIFAETRKLDKVKDLDKRRENALKAWALIPEPKEAWDYYGQSLSNSLVRIHLELGDEAGMKKWIKTNYKMYNDPDRQSLHTLSQEAISLYKFGLKDEAYPVFGEIYELFGREGFPGEYIQYLEFYLKERAKRGDMAADDGELPDDIYDRITILSENGNDALEGRGDADEAIGLWQEALKALPDPKLRWAAATWLHASIGEAHRMESRLPEALASFQMAHAADGGAHNAFVQYGLGACLFDLDRKADATDPLLRAYMLEGRDIFREGKRDYLDHLRAQGLVRD